MKSRRIFLWMLITSVVMTALLGTAAAMGLFTFIEWEIIGTAITVALFSVGALISGHFIESHRSPRLARAALGVGAAATSAMLVVTWAPSSLQWEYEEWLGMVAFSLLTVSLYLLTLAFVTSEPVLTAIAGLARLGTIVCGTIGVLILLGLLVAEAYDIGDWRTQAVFGRAVFFCILLGLAGTALLPILGRLSRANTESQHEKTLGERTPIRIACPRCDQEQSVQAGASKCNGCGLRFTIDFEEPRCACGYLLYGLRSETCPECGQNITQSQRWDGASAEPENGSSSAAEQDSSEFP